MYRHRPLYNVALYHELGHFLDKHHNIIGYSRLLSWYPDDKSGKREEYHRREYFADLVAASYAGYGYSTFLENIAHGNEDTDTHPALNKRLGLIDDFLCGKSNQTIELFQDVLRSRKFEPLQIRFTEPNIIPCFENVLPYNIASDPELHGILVSGWKFLKDIHDKKIDNWKTLDEFDADRIVNDLVEKSIRNRIITEKWKNELIDEKSYS